jgi:hypothetical protein
MAVDAAARKAHHVQRSPRSLRWSGAKPPLRVASAFLEERLTPERRSDALPDGLPETGMTPISASVDASYENATAKSVRHFGDSNLHRHGVM